MLNLIKVLRVCFCHHVSVLFHNKVAVGFLGFLQVKQIAGQHVLLPTVKLGTPHNYKSLKVILTVCSAVF